MLYHSTDQKEPYAQDRLSSLYCRCIIGTSAYKVSFAVADDAPGKEVILKAADINARICSLRRFSSAGNPRLRNSAIPAAFTLPTAPTCWPPWWIVPAIRRRSEKYQAYLLTEVPLEIGGQQLPAGAYGFGFINGGKFVVMDLGAHDVFQISSQRDADLKRPVPMQVVAGASRRRIPALCRA